MQTFDTRVGASYYGTSRAKRLLCRTPRRQELPPAVTAATRDRVAPLVPPRSRYDANVELIRALIKQAEAKALPVVQELIAPWLSGEPSPLTGTVDPEGLADPDSRFATVDGVRIHYKDHLYGPSPSTTPAVAVQPVQGPPLPGAPPRAGAGEDGVGAGGAREAAGKAPLVVLMLHGFNGSTFSFKQTKPGVGDLLARAGVPCRLISMDRPPFGLSERPTAWRGSGASSGSGGDDTDDSETNPYAAPGAGARFAAGLLRHLGVDEAVVLGHSAGAGVAVELALRHPDLVSGLVLVAPALPTSNRSPLDGLGLRQLLRLAATRALLGADGPGVSYVRRQVERRRREVMQGDVGGMYADAGSVDLDEVAEGYLKPLRAHGWDRALLEMYRSLNRSGGLLGGRSPDDYARLGAPVAVIQGGRDEAVAAANSRELVALMRSQRRGGGSRSGGGSGSGSSFEDEDGGGGGGGGGAEDRAGCGVAYFELHEVGHIPMEEAPEEFNRQLAGWLLEEIWECEGRPRGSEEERRAGVVGDTALASGG